MMKNLLSSSLFAILVLCLSLNFSYAMDKDDLQEKNQEIHNARSSDSETFSAENEEEGEFFPD